MKILIIEDEQLGVERLIRHLQAIDPAIEVVDTTRSIADSVRWLNTHEHPEIILMDIELTDGQSFEIFNQVAIKSAVIFTTSYDEYALKAFKVNSIDYLLKPVKKDELKAAIDKYKQLHHKPQNHNPNIEALIRELQQYQPVVPNFRQRFLVKRSQRLVSVEVTDIAYFFADGRVSIFVTWNKQKFIVDYTIEDLCDMLDPAQFFRANRAFIIHVRSVLQIHNYFNGKLKLELNPPAEKEVLISREKAGDFKAWMGK